MQDNNFSNDFSFAAIGGIHGYPFVQWGDSGNPTPPTDPDHFGGYCTHGSVVFPTWHRPYVALFEVIQTQLDRKSVLKMSCSKS